MGQFLPAITSSLAGAKHADGMMGGLPGCFRRLCGHNYGLV
jgi:hypothetical protein